MFVSSMASKRKVVALEEGEEKAQSKKGESGETGDEMRLLESTFLVDCRGNKIPLMEQFAHCLLKVRKARDDLQDFLALTTTQLKWSYIAEIDINTASFRFKHPPVLTTATKGHGQPSTNWLEEKAAGGSVVNTGSLVRRMEFGQKYVMRIKTLNGKWKPWISIRNSTVKDNVLGVFAERMFHKGSCLGYYVGETVWKSDGDHYTPDNKPTDEFIKSLHVSSIQYGSARTTYCYLDNSLNWRLVRVHPLETGEAGTAQSLMMGFHYIVSSGSSFSHDSPSYKYAIKMSNVTLNREGRVIATRRIELDDELVAVF